MQTQKEKNAIRFECLYYNLETLYPELHALADNRHAATCFGLKSKTITPHINSMKHASSHPFLLVTWVTNCMQGI